MIGINNCQAMTFAMSTEDFSI